MNDERSPRSGRVPLPGFAGSVSAEGWAPPHVSGATAPADRTRQARTEGLRRVRRISNWTAAALIVGTGATAVALAHNAVPLAAPTATSTSSTTGTTPAAAPSTATGPHLSHTVATTSASGVTTTTTTKVVNGKTVVTHVRHVPAYHDN